MAATSVLSQKQFPGKRQLVKDPSGDPQWNKVRFSGSAGASKTMHIAGGHLPKPPSVHPHHLKIGRRSHRAK
jgi:hypothetical protein